MEQDPLHDLELLIRSRYGALLVETWEEDRAQALVERAALSHIVDSAAPAQWCSPAEKSPCRSLSARWWDRCIFRSPAGRSTQDKDRLLANLHDLALAETEKLLTRTIVENGRLDADDIRRVIEVKQELIERDGLPEYRPAEESLDAVADLVHLKEWLGTRRLFMQDPERAAQFGLEFPHGLLLVGAPGCGQSLCAKAVAASWSLPLVQLDLGALYDKYIDETELNFRKAMGAADHLAALVLWIDEVEKAFAGGGGDEDGETSQRVLGTFLSWLQERPGDVFVVAAANDVQCRRPSCCARATSTRPSSSTFRTRRRARRYSASTSRGANRRRRAST